MGWAVRANPVAQDARNGKIKPRTKVEIKEHPILTKRKIKPEVAMIAGLMALLGKQR